MKNMTNIFAALFLALTAGYGTVWAAVSEAPNEVIVDTSNRMLDAMRKDRVALEQDPRKIYALVNQIVLPRFDFETMSQWVLGRYWRQATPAQRSRFVEEFRTLLVRTYGSSLLKYTDQQIRVLPSPSVRGDDVTVRSEVQQPNGPVIPINYSMHLNAGAWKVYDVTVNGVSLVTTYRSSFASEIRKNGMDALIRKLADRNAQGKRP